MLCVKQSYVLFIKSALSRLELQYLAVLFIGHPSWMGNLDHERELFRKIADLPDLH